MIIENSKKFIVWFNQNNNEDEYMRVLKNKFPEHKKCSKCNGIIYYYDSGITMKKNEIYLKGKSYQSKKNLNGEYYYLVVCQECLEKKFPEYKIKNKSKVFNVMSKITKYAYGIPNDISEQWKKDNYSITLNNLERKYGKGKAMVMWNNYLKKQADSNTFEYKKEKYGWTKEHFDEYNKNRSSTLVNMVKKHGEEIGLVKWNNYLDRQQYTCSKKYFIEKHGEVLGTEKYQNFCKKRCFNFSGVSKQSQDFFKYLDVFLQKEYTTYFDIKNHEYYISIKNEKFFFLDYYIKELNLAIEYNGDIFHANPKLYNKTDRPNPFNDMTSEQIWENDNYKLSTIKKIRNVDTIIVWENDVKKDGEEYVTNTVLEKIEKYKINKLL